MFDAKAKRFSQILGITREEYYSQYWIGKDGKDGLAQIIGEKGAANLENAEIVLANLSVAKEMEAAGKDAETIWLATGWEKALKGSGGMKFLMVRMNLIQKY
jgi:hypothetical protein